MESELNFPKITQPGTMNSTFMDGRNTDTRDTNVNILESILPQQTTA